MNTLPDSKTKSLRRRRPAPIELVSPLQLEECVYRLRNNLNVDDFKVFVDLEEQNCRKFTLHQYHGDHTIFYGEGTLRRWQGTSTRLEMDTIVAQSVFTRSILRLSGWLFFVAVWSTLFPLLSISMQPYTIALMCVLTFILIGVGYRQIAQRSRAAQYANIKQHLTALLSDQQERPAEIEVHEISRARQRHAGD